jgi:4-amino-4-deoxy-L-arabinose transferase-like glycosyltransferase
MLGLIWFLGAAIDRLWLAVDRSVPSWDPADNLTNALNFWWLFQQPHWWSGEWWTELWMRSGKYPPLLFVATVPFQNWFGTGADQALLVNLLFSAVLLLSVYGLGRQLFSPQVGLWAAGLCLLFPRLYTNRIDYFMDFPMTALVAASFCCLTIWRDAKGRSAQWLWILACGFCFGAAILTKQSALFFLLIPLLWVSIGSIKQRAWERLLQVASGSLLTLAIVFPWVRTNWIFQISAAFNSNIKSAANEGDPDLNTLDAWIYYWRDLPAAVSLPLLIVPLVGLVLYWLGLLPVQKSAPAQERSALKWLAVFWVGSYVLWSAIVNKDLRYIMPYLPIVAIGLAYGMTRWSYRWRSVAYGTVGLATVLMLLNLFPVGDRLTTWATQTLTPNAQLHPYWGKPLPHIEAIDEIIRTQPYQIANIGILASSPTVNQHNFNYYGNLRNFQVYARQMGRETEEIEDELESLSWFIVQQDRPRANRRRDDDDPRTKTIRAIEQSPDFQLTKTWVLPDRTRLKLFHRAVMPVTVQPSPANTTPQVRLEQVTLPDRTPPGKSVPITYQWAGSWEQLHAGLVLLTWRHQSDRRSHWLHDHGIGLGSLHPPLTQAIQPTIGRSTVDPTQSFQVIERTAMRLPKTAIAGTYTLEATYLNAQTGETYPIATPPISLTVDPVTSPVAAPPVDWVTQLRLLATDLPEGLPEIDPVFGKLGQINMYDPIQNYAVQAEKTLEYRLQQDPQNRDYAYGLALARVLQQRVNPAIAALEKVVQLDPQNPNAYAYLAIVNLYDLRSGAAQAALRPALALKPDAPELQAIDGAIALMRGNLWKAWQQGRAVLAEIKD